MPLRVIYDTSAVLAQMTPDPRDGSILWRWMTDGVVQPMVSDCLIGELCRSLELARIALLTAMKRTYALFFRLKFRTDPQGARQKQ